MKTSRHIPHVHIVVMNTSSFNERALALGDDFVHVRGKARRKDLCKQLCDVVDEADGSVVRN